MGFTFWLFGLSNDALMCFCETVNVMVLLKPKVIQTFCWIQVVSILFYFLLKCSFVLVWLVLSYICIQSITYINRCTSILFLSKSRDINMLLLYEFEWGETIIHEHIVSFCFLKKRDRTPTESPKSHGLILRGTYDCIILVSEVKL